MIRALARYIAARTPPWLLRIIARAGGRIETAALLRLPADDPIFGDGQDCRHQERYERDRDTIVHIWQELRGYDVALAERERLAAGAERNPNGEGSGDA